MLSREERRRFDEIAFALVAEDPAFADRVRAVQPSASSTGIGALVLMVLGGIATVAGMVGLNGPVVLVSVLTFLVGWVWWCMRRNPEGDRPG